MKQVLVWIEISQDGIERKSVDSELKKYIFECEK
jgi:hypothetical protein